MLTRRELVTGTALGAIATAASSADSTASPLGHTPSPTEAPQQDIELKVIATKTTEIDQTLDGLAGVVRERSYTGASAFFLVESDTGERFEVLAEPEAAKVGDRVFVRAERVIRFTDNGR